MEFSYLHLLQDDLLQLFFDLACPDRFQLQNHWILGPSELQSGVKVHRHTFHKCATKYRFRPGRFTHQIGKLLCKLRHFPLVSVGQPPEKQLNILT